ncbi:MAG: flagellar protein FlaR [Verrucomicrobia bacterium]|nr:flagellar protein FlaR [Verrucomicrobiota bacterium]
MFVAQPTVDFDRLQRLAVIGNAGAGKSTLCGKLGSLLRLPVYSLDSIMWREGWAPVPADEVARISRGWLQGDRWIVDGFGTWDFIEEEFERADSIVFLDHALAIHYAWAIKRQFRDLFRPRPDLPKNCPMFRMTIPLLKTIWFTHKLARPQLLKQLDAVRDRKQVIHLRSPAQIHQFLQAVKAHGSGQTDALAENSRRVRQERP